MNASNSHRYPAVPSQPKLPDLEQAVLARWKDEGTFEQSVEQREPGTDGDNEFVFYDGPPFANGLPHYGHLLTGYVKDAIPRYQTMRARRVARLAVAGGRGPAGPMPGADAAAAVGTAKRRAPALCQPRRR